MCEPKPSHSLQWKKSFIPTTETSIQVIIKTLNEPIFSCVCILWGKLQANPSAVSCKLLSVISLCYTVHAKASVN